MKTLLLTLALALSAPAAYSEDKPVPIYNSGLEIDQPGVNTPIYEVCLNGVKYYIISVHSGWALAPKHSRLKHGSGNPVMDRDGQPVVKSAPDAC